MCYLSPAAAETICQAASTAAAAAAAAVRSAVLTLDGEDPPLLGSHPGEEQHMQRCGQLSVSSAAQLSVHVCCDTWSLL